MLRGVEGVDAISFFVNFAGSFRPSRENWRGSSSIVSCVVSWYC